MNLIQYKEGLFVNANQIVIVQVQGSVITFYTCESAETGNIYVVDPPYEAWFKNQIAEVSQP